MKLPELIAMLQDFQDRHGSQTAHMEVDLEDMVEEYKDTTITINVVRSFTKEVIVLTQVDDE